MERNLRTGEKDNSASDLMSSLNRRRATSHAPTMLTPSEIELLRRDLAQTLDEAEALKLGEAA